jgi:hypothetical protein
MSTTSFAIAVIATVISLTNLLMSFARTPPEDAGANLGRWRRSAAGWFKSPFFRLLSLAIFGASMFWLGAGTFGSSPPAPPESATSVYGFWQFTDNTTVPVEKKSDNIANWYASYSESIYVRMEDQEKRQQGGFNVPPRWTISILFGRPTKYRQLIATCSRPDTKCAVQGVSDRFAVLTIVGEVAGMTLELTSTQ